MRKQLWSILAVLVLLSLVLAACSPAAPAQPAAPTTAPATEAEPTAAPAAEAEGDDFKVAFVYVAPIGDLGWTWAQDQGRLAVEEELGVETAYIENVPEGPDAERVIRDFAQKGYDLIFTTSFGFMDPTITVAKEFPETWFVHISGYKTAENVSTVFGGIEEARYLSGLVAGKMTKTNIIGYVAAFPIPEVIRGINGFTQGVREVNPDAEVRVVWTQTWFDPVKEKEAADALLDQNADIIAQHQDTTEPQKAAQERGLMSIGYDSDMAQFVGDSVLTSPIWLWGPKYVEITKAVMDGTYATESYYGQFKDDPDIFDLAPLSAQVPADVAALVEERKAALEDGTFAVFCGPLTSASGVELLGEGKCMTLEEKLSMDYFIEGVRGEAPTGGKALEGEAAPEGAAAPVAGAGETKAIKAAFIYVGPVGDLGWSYAHDQGRLQMAEELGIETAISEAVPEGPDAERVIRDYAQKGYNVIVATSFGYMDSVMNVAKDFPDVTFLHATGYQTADNVGIYDGRGYQGWYLAGIVAGKMTKTNSLGYVAPYAIPEVIRNMNAFALGARSVNPEATVTPIWINAWFDVQKERDAAQALLDTGADVIARESDSVEPDKLAEQEGVFAIGYNAVSAEVAPNAVLTAPIWDWSVYYTQAMQDIAAGTWEPTPVWWGMKEGLLALAPYGDMVPEDVQALVEEEKARIIAGEFDVFVGPLNDNAGTEKVAAGVSMTDEEMLAFNWLVEGVKGSIPAQ
jgi:basic membrane protein A and related proteins